jgi:hypothetical protein
MTAQEAAVLRTGDRVLACHVKNHVKKWCEAKVKGIEYQPDSLVRVSLDELPPGQRGFLKHPDELKKR